MRITIGTVLLFLALAGGCSKPEEKEPVSAMAPPGTKIAPGSGVNPMTMDPKSLRRAQQAGQQTGH